MLQIENLCVTLVCVVFVVAIFKVFFSSGQLSKFLNSVFYIFVFLCVVSPIISLLQIENNIDLSQSLHYEIDNAFVQNIQLRNYEKTAKSVQKTLKNEYNCEFLVNFNTKLKNDNLEIDKVFVNIQELVLKQNGAHTHLVSEIKTMVANAFGLQEDRVEICEWK